MRNKSAFLPALTGILYQHPVVALGLLFSLGCVLIFGNLYVLARQLNENTATQFATQYADSLEKVRDLYTSEVVDRLEGRDVMVTYDYRDHEGAIPYPATFSHLLSREMLPDKAGTWTNMYSDYPWPWRKDGGPRDDYEQEALAALRRHPAEPYVRLVEEEGRQTFRFSRGVIMREYCVACHNSHEKSPKQDWQVGDVRGVLEVALPMNSSIATIRKGLLGTLVATLLGAICGLFLLALVINRLRDSMAEINRTNTALTRFVPHEFLGLLDKQSIVDVGLGDHVILDMTILFSDIRSFTNLSEQMSPAETFGFVNEYFAAMGPVVREHGGFIDKFIGDAIMALFSSADDALAAAVAMHGRLVAMNMRRAAAGMETIKMGIGLNSGELMLGTIGDQNRMDGSVISDAVNLASRIEGLTKRYCSRILISEDTRSRLQQAERFNIRPVDLVRVKGKTRPVRIFEVIDADPLAELKRKLASREMLENGFRLVMEKHLAEALEFFNQCRARDPEDFVFANLADRCETLIASGCEDECDVAGTMESK